MKQGDNVFGSISLYIRLSLCLSFHHALLFDLGFGHTGNLDR